MTSALTRARKARFAGLVLLCSSAFCLTGCNDGSGDPNAEIGAHPNLPEPTQYLLPPMHIAHIVGWSKDETPTVAQGLKIQPLAKGLEHPRSVYVLPNGDVLVVEVEVSRNTADQAAQGFDYGLGRIVRHIRRRREQ